MICRNVTWSVDFVSLKPLLIAFSCVWKTIACLIFI